MAKNKEHSESSTNENNKIVESKKADSQPERFRREYVGSPKLTRLRGQYKRRLGGKIN